MTDLIHIAILLLAIFRLTRMIHTESLPFNIGAKFRFWLPDSFLSRHWLTSWIVDLFMCPYCLMLWATIGVYFLNKSELGYTVIVILAMSAGGMFVWDIWEMLQSYRFERQINRHLNKHNPLSAENIWEIADESKVERAPGGWWFGRLYREHYENSQIVRERWDRNQRIWVIEDDNSETET